MADWTLRNHLEKHEEILDTLFYICDDIERSRTVIRLLMKILSKEQEVTFTLMLPSVHLEETQSSPDQHSINGETEFFPNAASTCAFEVANANQKVYQNSILTPGVPEVFKVDQNSDSYVPDTCLMEDIGDKEIHDSQKAFNLTIVPETQDAFPETETSNSKSMNLERRVQHFDNICSDITETFGDPNPHREIKTERKSEEQLKDEAIREKYHPLSVSTKSTATGSCDNSANDTLAANSDCESPSILSNYSRKNSKRKHISPQKDNELNDDDDFKTPFSTVSSSSFCEEPKRKKRPPSKQPSSTTMKSATNSYGMTVTMATDSQLMKTHNMKQSNIKDIFTKGVKKPVKTESSQEEEDLQKALRESLKENSNGGQTCVNENDSFDDYEVETDENAWKHANIPVKKKSDREKLKGFSCKDCEDYYRNVNLTENQRQELVQKCSRHRATIEPPTSSPKEMWEVDIEGPDAKTQYQTSPLKTRDRRKLSRQQRK